ncbi:hypothetical protein EDB19DRAFT_1351793 [Suillus lakei]|nr:hypothetical protein EDB19DRAFT_1351793 [Suillus lakei]
MFWNVPIIYATCLYSLCVVCCWSVLSFCVDDWGRCHAILLYMCIDSGFSVSSYLHPFLSCNRPNGSPCISIDTKLVYDHCQIDSDADISILKHTFVYCMVFSPQGLIPRPGSYSMMIPDGQLVRIAPQKWSPSIPFVKFKSPHDLYFATYQSWGLETFR